MTDGLTDGAVHNIPIALINQSTDSTGGSTVECRLGKGS